MSEQKQPRYVRKKTRVNMAVVKHYKEGWSVDEIAEYLRVRPETVRDYLDSPPAQEVERVLVEDAAAVRVEMAQRYMSKLERLDQLEQELLHRRKMVVSNNELEYVEGVVLPQEGSWTNPAEQEELLNTVKQLPKPVATAYRQVVDIQDDLRVVWDQQADYEEKLEDLLGLEAPKRAEIDSTHEERSVEVKVWRMEDGDYPAQPIYEEEEADALPKTMGGKPAPEAVSIEPSGPNDVEGGEDDE